MRYEACSYEFDEEVDLKAADPWFVDTQHVLPTGEVAGINWGCECVQHGFCWAAEKLSLPATKGVLWRNYKNVSFIIHPIVPIEAEKKQRSTKCNEIFPEALKNFSREWEGAQAELLSLYEPHKKADLKKASLNDLARKLVELKGIGLRMGEIHFYYMYQANYSFLLFEGFCKENLRFCATDPRFHALIRGYDNLSFKYERELFRLARRAVEIDLAPVFKQFRPEEIAPRLRESENGRKWLKELDDFLQEYGWRCAVCWYQSTPTLIEDPSIILGLIKSSYLQMEEPPAQVHKFAKEREKAISEVSAKLPADKRELFNFLLNGASHADSFSEGHDLICEMPVDALFRRYLLEVGRRFADAGTIKEVSEIFWLGFDEVRKVASCPEVYRLHSLVKGRIAKAQEDSKSRPNVVSKRMSEQEAFQWMTEEVKDPNAVKTLIGEVPKAKPELKADLIGVGGASGVAEGPARVIFSHEELVDVKPGEILVSPTTSVSWTVVFALIKGVVCDRGGTLCHAAIVARQYGIPCVVNTFSATSTIKTGQRIRVDGNEGAIYILG